MTCKDCICSEVCYYKSFNDVRNLEKRRNDVEKICKSFVHRDILKNVPTVDAVEVVRCKDCRFCKKHPTADKVKMCTNEQQWVTECYPLVHDKDFCSYGERKDNG